MVLTGTFLQLVCNIMNARSFLFSLLAGGFTLLSAAVSDAGGLSVATMHPVLTPLAEVIGGDKVKVTSIVPAGGEVHRFSPTASDVKKLADMKGKPIMISGLWGLSFGNDGSAGRSDTLFFTSGPHTWRGVTEDEVHGLLGSIAAAE